MIDANQKQLNSRSLQRRCLRVSALVVFAALVPLAANAQPAAPAGLLAAAGDEQAVLTWTDPSNPDIVRYEFRYGAGEEPEFNAWAGVSGSGYTVSGLANGTRYGFEVRAVEGTATSLVVAHVRTADGFVTSMHDTAPRAEDGSLWIPFFNPGSNRNQASRLRLVNWGETAAEVTIMGTDDAGNSPGEAVRVTVPARSARDYMAWELETGSAAGLSGALGDGAGKWRLRVSALEDVEAMSLLGLPTGHVTNLSTTPRHPPE